MISNVLERMIDIDYLIKFADKWSKLASLQTSVIDYLRTNSYYYGSYSDFMRIVGFKATNVNMNIQLIKWLNDKNIINIEEFDINKVPNEYRQFIKVNSRIKTFKLEKDWLDNLYNADDFSYDDIKVKKGE
jgi:hypothetical protein